MTQRKARWEHRLDALITMAPGIMIVVGALVAVIYWIGG